MLRIDSSYLVDAQSANKSADLHPLLQSALKLEHATIPPYLTAAYSLKAGVNDPVRRMIVNVAEEEMLHMAVVANVLNAIGGRPKISDPAFIPTYPGPLPMCIGGELTVGLKQCSKVLIADVFMRIEEPEKRIPIESFSWQQFSTIGQFYAAIVEKIKQLGDEIFTGDPARQVVGGAGFPMPQLFAITNVETAVRALNRVVEEGEGTKRIPFDDEGEPAHFYRFESIFKGNELVEDPQAPSGYSYSGAEIRFDESEVWDFPDDTKAADYAEGTEERRRVDRFNATYSEVVRQLQEAFDGNPPVIATARSSMTTLKNRAISVVSRTNPATGRQCGLTFEYVPAT